MLLLGSPEIRWQETLFSITRQAPRSLLFYLASRGTPISRDELATLFWPEETEHTSRLRLRETLSKLRNELPQTDILLTKEHLVWLNSDLIYVDLLEFRELTTQAGRLPWNIPADEPLPGTLYRKLLRAFQLWRSPNLLAGYQFSSSLRLDVWFSNIANHSESLYRRIAERLANHEEALGNLESALQLARQVATAHELEEEYHVHVMRLLVKAGKTQEARLYYKDVQRLFQRELNSQPGPELAALYQQVCSDSPSMSSKPNLHWNIHSSMQVPFVGRQKYLQQLQQAYQRGEGLIILGDSGQGKTRLIKEFTSRLKPMPRIFLAQCLPGEIHLPFQPLSDVLRQNTSPQEWLSLPRLWAEPIQSIIPDLKSFRSDLKARLENPTEQSHTLLLEAMRQFFLILTKSQRVILIFDDAQWADEASLNALAYLAHRPPFGKQAQLLVAARQEESGAHLEKFISFSHPAKTSGVLRLSQMDLNEIDDLVHQVLGISPTPHFVARLEQDTGGNPFFILETLHSLIRQEAAPTIDSLNALPISGSVHSLIQQRVQNLSEPARTILEIAALTGKEFNTGILVKVSGLDEEKVSAAVEELETQLLWERVEKNEPEPIYCFVHEKFREALLLKINPVRAQSIHRKIALASLPETGGLSSSQPAVLAEHFEAAGVYYPAYQQWFKAGQHARQLFAYTEATQAFLHAERLIDRCLDQLNDEQIYDLYREWGEIAYSANDFAVLEGMNTSLVRLGEQLKSPLLTGLAYTRLGNACYAAGKLKEGLDYTRLAIQQLSQTDHVYQLIATRENYGVVLYLSGQINEAIQTFVETFELLPGDSNPQSILRRASLLDELGMSLILNGQLSKGRDHCLESLQDHRLIHHIDGMAGAYAKLTLAEYFLGNYEQALEYSQLGFDLAYQSQSWRNLGYLSIYRGMLEFALGNIDGLLDCTQKAIEISQQIGRPDLILVAHRLVADVFYTLNDFENCQSYLQKSYPGNQDSFITFDIYCRIIAVKFILTRQPEFIDELNRLIKQAEANGFILGKLHVQMSLAMAYHMLRDWETVGKLVEDIQQTALLLGFKSFIVGGLLILAHCKRLAGQHDLALQNITESVQEAEGLSFRWLEITGRVALNHFNQQDHSLAEANRNRINKLLAFLNDHCQKELFKPALQSYIAKVEHNLA